MVILSTSFMQQEVEEEYIILISIKIWSLCSNYHER